MGKSRGSVEWTANVPCSIARPSRLADSTDENMPGNSVMTSNVIAITSTLCHYFDALPLLRRFAGRFDWRFGRQFEQPLGWIANNSFSLEIHRFHDRGNK